MTRIVAIDPERVEFEPHQDQEPPRLRLVLTDTDGLLHSLELEGRALSDLGEIFRAIREQYPGALGVH